MSNQRIATLTPVIAADYGWTASFVVAAGVCLVSAVAWLFIDPDYTLMTGSSLDR